MPPLPANVAAADFRRSDSEQSHAHWPGTRREGTGPGKTVRLDGGPDAFRMVSGIVRNGRGTGAPQNLFCRRLPLLPWKNAGWRRPDSDAGRDSHMLDLD